MAGSPIPSEAEVADVLHGAHNEYLKELEKDIRKSSTIQKKWQTAYIGNCRRLRDEMYEYQFEFIDGTLAKINRALAFDESDELVGKRKDIYTAFEMVFDEIAVRCTLVDNQIKTILKALTEQDPNLARKYGIYLTAGIGTAFVAGALGAVLIGHTLPATICAATIGAAIAPPILIVAAVILAITSGFFLYKALTTNTKLETHSFVRNWAAQCFPTFGKLGPHDNCTDKEIEEKFHKIMCSMKSDEVVWKSNVKLETLKTSLEANEKRLKEEQIRIEKEDAALSGKK